MKNKLKEKLLELGYASSYIDDKLKDWDNILKEKKTWEGEENDVMIERYEEPTEEVPRFFLNVGNQFENVLLFDGDVSKVYKENSLGDGFQFADYLVSSKLCLLRNVKKSKSENFILRT